jgi:hypothetical protein
MFRAGSGHEHKAAFYCKGTDCKKPTLEKLFAFCFGWFYNIFTLCGITAPAGGLTQNDMLKMWLDRL